MIDKRHDTGGHSSQSDSETIDSRLRDWTSSPPASPPLSDTRGENFDNSVLVCDACRSRLVYPADCEEHDLDHWSVELWCPECGACQWARFDIEMLDLLARELDQAEAEIKADLECLIRADMADYVNRFVAALDAGAIGPEDFAT